MAETKTEDLTMRVVSATAAELIGQLAENAGSAALASRMSRVAGSIRQLGRPIGRCVELDRIIEGADAVFVAGLLRQCIGDRQSLDKPGHADDMSMPEMRALVADSVLVELTNPTTFWTEIRLAQQLAICGGVPNDPSSLAAGTPPIGAASSGVIYTR